MVCAIAWWQKLILCKKCRYGLFPQHGSIVDSKCSDYDEVHPVFDRCTSLKESTRERRQGGKPVITYHVADNTPVGKVSAKQFLSSTTTKDELIDVRCSLFTIFMVI